MFNRLVLVFSLILVSTCTSAYDKACHPYSPIGDLEDHWGIKVSCICGAGLAHIESDDAGELPLIGVCGYGQGASESLGDYFFKGNVLITGKILAIANSQHTDDIITFIGDKSAEKLWSNVIGNSVNLSRSKGQLNMLGIPQPSEKNSCWVADARIRFRELMVRLDDSDWAGSIPIKFEVIQRGKYLKCKASDYNY